MYTLVKLVETHLLIVIPAKHKQLEDKLLIYIIHNMVIGIGIVAASQVIITQDQNVYPVLFHVTLVQMLLHALLSNKLHVTMLYLEHLLLITHV